MNYSRIRSVPEPRAKDDVLPIQLPWREAVAVYLKRLWWFGFVVFLNILVWGIYLTVAFLNTTQK